MFWFVVVGFVFILLMENSSTWGGFYRIGVEGSRNERRFGMFHNYFYFCQNVLELIRKSEF